MQILEKVYHVSENQGLNIFLDSTFDELRDTIGSGTSTNNNPKLGQDQGNIKTSLDNRKDGLSEIT